MFDLISKIVKIFFLYLVIFKNFIFSDGTVTRRGVRETRSYNSRRSSTDSSEDGVPPPGSITNLKSELRDMEEKFKKAMVNIASLDNDKCQLMFQVKLLH